MADTSDLKSDGRISLAGSIPVIGTVFWTLVHTKSKGSRLTFNGSKGNVWQGSKRQVRKDVARGVIARECPVTSYVSSFFTPNFAGFLFGNEPTL